MPKELESAPRANIGLAVKFVRADLIFSFLCVLANRRRRMRPRRREKRRAASRTRQVLYCGHLLVQFALANDFEGFLLLLHVQYEHEVVLKSDKWQS
jgi:hypothetical protein